MKEEAIYWAASIIASANNTCGVRGKSENKHLLTMPVDTSTLDLSLDNSKIHFIPLISSLITPFSETIGKMVASISLLNSSALS